MGLLLTPSTDMRSRVRSGLLERGLAPHIADAFVMNFQDESGLNPGINEIEPLVPGSRGGFGLYQLTGPRRVAYEQFAQQRGVEPADVDAQLDFMMMELQGPESRAAQRIFAAPDTGTAAAAIVTDFLRPAEEHRNRRVARYTGGQSSQQQAPRGILSTMNTEPEAPMQQEKIGGLLGRLFPDMDADRADELRLSLNGMLHRPNQGRAQAIQARMGGRAEGRERQQQAAQQQQQANRTAQWLSQQPGGQQYAQAIASGALPAGEALTMWRAASQGQEPTALMQNVEFIQRQNPGMSFDQALQAARSGQTINVNSASEVGTIPPGYELFTDEQGNRRMRPISGGPVAIEQEQAERANAERVGAADRQQGVRDTVVGRDVDRLIGMIDQGGIFNLPESGIVGGLLGSLGVNQEAVDFKNTLAGIQATVAFDRLQQMRDASKTGGALGAVSERELDLLISAYGALQQNTSGPVLKSNLQTIKDVMTKIANDPVASSFYYGGGGQTSQGQAPSGGFSVTGRID